MAISILDIHEQEKLTSDNNYLEKKFCEMVILF